MDKEGILDLRHECPMHILFYATLAYIRHFIFAGCYDNNPRYEVTNLAGHLDFAGHLDLAGFYFSKCPAKFVTGSHIHLVMDEAQVKYIECAWA
jgi:hypothetical protein